jgi:flagellar hook protein FlgE
MGFSSAMMSGVSGLWANDTALSVIGNNIANVNTTGFKSGRTLFEDMLYKDVTGARSQIGLGTSVLAVQNQFLQGSFLSSDNATDLAINGDGFFVVQDNTATPTTKYTRAGTFNVDVNSQYLVNPDGDRLCDLAGAMIDLTSLAKFSSISSIASDGTISYMDTTGTEQASTIKVGIARFASLDGLEKEGGNNYVATAASGVATTAAANSDTKILYKTLEQSNVDMATELVSMITTQRAYTANSKTVTTSDEMTQTLINLKR